MSFIFISYRRSDSYDVVSRIYDQLRESLGPEKVFRDIHSIPLGVDFRRYLRQAVEQCGIQLVVIGPNWLQASDREGRRRLDDPNDWVRIEVESALGREIPVVPVLVNGAAMPRAEDLPEGLKELAYRHGAQVRPDPDFHHDMGRLIKWIKNHLEETVE